jgi:hypothetical protein
LVAVSPEIFLSLMQCAALLVELSVYGKEKNGRGWFCEWAKRRNGETAIWRYVP